MTRQQKLDILLLLSALESWGFSNNQRLPNYLHKHLQNSVGVLRKEVLN